MKLVVTQEGTIEGYAAAWVAKRALKGDCEIVQMKAGDKIPPVAGRDVLFFGISFSRHLVTKIKSEAKSFAMFDNDFQARQELAGIKYVTISLSRTPARMAWEHLRADFKVRVGKNKENEFHFHSAPWIVDYTENRKLWKWPDLNPFFIKTAIEECYPFELESFDELSTRDLSVVIAQGKEFLSTKAKTQTQTEETTDHGDETREGAGPGVEHGTPTRRARRKLSKR